MASGLAPGASYCTIPLPHRRCALLLLPGCHCYCLQCLAVCRRRLGAGGSATEDGYVCRRRLSVPVPTVPTSPKSLLPACYCTCSLLLTCYLAIYLAVRRGLAPGPGRDPGRALPAVKDSRTRMRRYAHRTQQPLPSSRRLRDSTGGRKQFGATTHKSEETEGRGADF